jgi:acetylornithine deacetylase/succinyl-diaminopimelate desuccinylase-like protein
MPRDLIDLVDKSLVVDLAKEMVDTPSPTGEEGDMARLLQRMFRHVGLSTQLQNIYDDRSNSIGRLNGAGSGPAILMSGHMDTSVRGDEEYLVGQGWKNHAVIEDGRVYGNGIMNMKNAFVSYIAGVDALRRSGLKLKGDLILAGTVGEIELGAIDEFRGKHFHGAGLGTRYMLIHGVSADYHLLGEPTDQTPVTGMMGACWAKVTTHGDFSHTAYTHQSLSAIDEMLTLWHALSEWIDDYRSRNIYRDVVPAVNRAAIRGGLPWRPARTCNQCSLYIDIRFPPTRYPIDIEREFTAVVNDIAKRALKRPVEIEYYLARGGTRLPDEHPVIQAVVDAHRETTGEAVPAQFCPPFCTDAIDSNRLGVPTCVYGSGGTTRRAPESGDARAAQGEFVEIDDMVSEAATVMNAAIKLNEMSLEKVISLRGPMPGVS